jgi:hypothetical protein
MLEKVFLVCVFVDHCVLTKANVHLEKVLPVITEGIRSGENTSHMWSRVGHVTHSNPDMYFSENSPVKTYSTEMLFTVIKCISSFSQPISIFFLNYFLRPSEGTLAYHSVKPES